MRDRSAHPAVKGATVLLALLASAQVAAATPVQLTWHMVDGSQDGVLSTQPPPAGQVALNGVSGLFGPPDCAGTGQVNDFGSTWRAYSSVSGAWYEEGQDGTPVLFGSPGIAGDVPLVGAEGVLHWVLAVRDDAGLGAPATLPIVLDVTVSSVTEPWSEEPTEVVLAAATTGPLLLAADATQGATHAMVDGHHVYEVDVPLRWQTDALRAGGIDSYGRGAVLAVQVVARHDLPCPQDTIRAGMLLAFSADGHRPNLSLDVGATLVREYVHPQFLGDDLVVHLSLNSAWGKYDVGAVEVTMTRPDGSTQALPDVTQAPRFHEHSPRDLRFGAGPLGRTFAVPIADAAAGNHSLHVRASNLAGTESWEGTAYFEVAPRKESPTPPMAAAVVLLALLAATRRRA